MSKKPEKLQAGERAFDWLLLIFSLVVFYQAYQISGFSSINSAGAFPVGLSLIMIASSIAVLAGHRRKTRPETRGPLDELAIFLRTHFPTNVLVFCVLAIAYLAAIQPFSFFVSTFVFLAAAFIYLRQGKVVSSLIISALSIAVIYGLFTVVFRVYLP
ncbi:tripartite tricarboxylate transporter TctB family protein [Litchfieldella rifensis]|uniref:Tripartite tricarboxylate transporter TctB family protein n=1 Tax=Litchfieldella rifensis TaxID=762643 RepID=A0ABV7LLP3_9GAMM